MTKCLECDGLGKHRNPKWDEASDRLESNYPSQPLIERELKRRGLEEYYDCKLCNGTGKA